MLVTDCLLAGSLVSLDNGANLSGGAAKHQRDPSPGTLEQSIKATAISGQVSVIGWIPSDVSTMSISAFYFNLVTLRPIYIGSRAQFQAMNNFIAHHRLKPVIDRVFPFDEAKVAYQYYEEARPFGKVVISQQ